MAHFLSLTSVSWQVKQQQILQNISFDVAQGDSIGIVGPNGAGKTSLLKCLLNQHRDYSGDITLYNKSLKSYKVAELAKIFALVQQSTSAIFNLTVFDVVSMGLLPYQGLFSTHSTTDKQSVLHALAKVGLEHHAKQFFNTLSGGEQQRALIAKALVQQPKVMILDEPSNHLDVFYQHQIFTLLEQLNTTVIMSIHDINLAAKYCNKIALLNQGTLVAYGRVEQVLTPERLSQVFALPCYQYQIADLAQPLFYFQPKSDQHLIENSDIQGSK